jgi:hypothetical protein
VRGLRAVDGRGGVAVSERGCQAGPRGASWPMHFRGDTQPDKAGVGPTSGPTRRLSHSPL